MNKQATGLNTRDGRALSRPDFLANTAVLGAALVVVPTCAPADRFKDGNINPSDNGPR